MQSFLYRFFHFSNNYWLLCFCDLQVIYTVSLLKKKGINDIGIVVGYQDDVIKEVLSDEKAIKFFHNQLAIHLYRII